MSDTTGTSNVMSTTGKKSVHPPVSKMVTAAIKTLSTHKGVSLQAIKKYIQDNYQAEMDKRMVKSIGRYLKGAVEKGDLIQPKGKGAAGSFKLSTAAAAKPKKKSSKPKVSRKPTVAAAVAEKKSKATVASPAKKKAPAKPKKAPVAKKSLSMEKKVASPKPRKAPKAIKSPVMKAAKVATAK